MAVVRVHRDHLDLIAQAISDLRGGAPSATVYGTSYTTADLDATLIPLYEKLSVKSAIESVEQGDQAFSLGNRSFTKADLPELYDRLQQLERAETRSAQGGSRVRNVVPLG